MMNFMLWGKVGLGATILALVSALYIQTKRAEHYRDTSRALESEIAQIRRANLLTESIDRYNEQIYDNRRKQLEELRNVPDLDDSLPLDLRRLLSRMRENP